MKPLLADRISQPFRFSLRSSGLVVKCNHNIAFIWHACRPQMIAGDLISNVIPRYVRVICKEPQQCTILPLCILHTTVLANFLKSCLLPIGKLGFRECQRRRQSDQSGYQCSFHNFRIPVSIPVQIAVADCFEQSFLTGAA